MNFWKDKNVVVTGGAGFLGQFVVQELKNKGCRNIFVPRKKDCDLRDLTAIRKMIKQVKPNFIVHLAAVVGGIGANRENPGQFFYDNLIMGVQLMEEARLSGIEKFVAIGTICAYPKFTKVPFKEEDLWKGYPEETNAPYGLAKKMLLVQSQAYRQQYNFNSLFLLPVNLYGPSDNFFPQESTHVIPAVIKKCFDAVRKDQDHILVWGSGKPTREFLYVEDAARAIVMASEKYNKSEPINIGSGEEVSIKELVRMVVDMTGFKGKILWDAARPDGQPKRRLDITKAHKEFGFKAKVTLELGLKKTIDWYRKQEKFFHD